MNKNFVFTLHYKRLLLCVLLASLFLLGACAKHPAATDPIDGIGSANGKAAATTASKQEGTRYKYGGTTPQGGFDCSGFVLWVYAQHGVTMPRTAGEQAQAGKKIDRNALQPGDIVVFRISKRLPYHTGVYLGENTFIHSPRTGERVRREDMNLPYWKQRFLGARRIIQS